MGRDTGAALVLSDARVSRKHLRIHVAGGRIAVEDLGSDNGTRIVEADEAPRSHAAETEKATATERAIEPHQRVSLRLDQAVLIGRTTLVVQAAKPAVLRNGRMPPSSVSPAMAPVLDFVARIARGTLPVLIVGETGSGKELMAQRLHELSARSAKPLLRLNCGAFTESLLESELFGFERGAFTGAVQASVGLLESADGGTVFLDEIGELPPSLQVKLLRVMEEQMIRRVGGTTFRPIDVRFVAATHRDLGEEARQGRFREDLYYRIHGALVRVPPLRERPEDVAPLAHYFASHVADTLGQSAPVRFTADAMRWLESRPWPGNVRELRNMVERGVLVAHGEPIRVAHLDGSSAACHGPSVPPSPAAPRQSMHETVARVERGEILRALDVCAGNQSKAAKLLGVSRNTLISRLRTLDIPRARER